MDRLGICAGEIEIFDNEILAGQHQKVRGTVGHGTASAVKHWVRRQNDADKWNKKMAWDSGTWDKLGRALLAAIEVLGYGIVILDRCEVVGQDRESEREVIWIIVGQERG